MDFEQMKWRFAGFKEKAKQKTAEAVEFAKENPGTVIAGISALTGLATVTIRGCNKIANTRDERKRRTEVYCGDIQQFVRLKHELKYNEAVELRKRMNEGETRFEALSKMGLLK